jgi:hypothetical protein
LKNGAVVFTMEEDSPDSFSALMGSWNEFFCKAAEG